MIYIVGMMVVVCYYVDIGIVEEVVQDCWVMVIDVIGWFEGCLGLKIWLYWIVVNWCKNKLRVSYWEIIIDFIECLELELES